jgi:predicted alpha/beta-hydrolase family hydrolase
MMAKKIFIDICKKRKISALITEPLKKGSLSGCVFVIAHGSSNDMHHNLIRGVSDIYSANGGKTIRFNFLFREENIISRTIRMDNSLSYLKAYEYAGKNLVSENDLVFACGKSLGSKVGAELISSGRICPDGFISFGYPLHSKNYFDRLKFRPLESLNVPSMFFTGEHDPLCKIDFFTQGLNRLKINSRLHIIKKADHGLGIDKKYSESIFEEIFQSTSDWINASRSC